MTQKIELLSFHDMVLKTSGDSLGDYMSSN